MKNIKMTISYDGTRYYGWERQPDRDTIQGKLEAVLSRMCGSSVEVIGAGRTDGGVHARAMTANAHIETSMTEEEIQNYLNTYLPEDISVDEVREASERFHARYLAVGKLYTYTCYIGHAKPVFDRRYVTILPEVPDVGKMQQASACLIGEHDFRSFCGNTHFKKSTVRTVDQIEIKRKGNLLTLSFHGTGFLQNMVRILVGTLLEVGYGRIAPEEMKNILEAKNRQASGPCAPPQGLCMMKVDYN